MIFRCRQIPSDLFHNTALTGLVLLLLSGNGSSQDALEREFNRLNDSRRPRILLIDYLIEQEAVRETSRGTLEYLRELSGLAKENVDEENYTRLKMFGIIAQKENRPADRVARDFYVRRFGEPPKNPPPPKRPTPPAPQKTKNNGQAESAKIEFARLFRIDGDRSAGASLLPALAEAFFKDRGYLEIHRDANGPLARIIARKPSYPGTRFDTIDIRGSNSGSAFAGSGKQDKFAGLAGGYCDLGLSVRPVNKGEAEKMIKAGRGNPRTFGNEHILALDGLAVVVHPKNKADSLSVPQIASILSGKTKRWNEILRSQKGPIHVCALKPDSGIWESAAEAISRYAKFDPGSISPKTTCADSSEVIRNVARNPQAIGVVPFGLVGGEPVKALKVRGWPGSFAVYPSRLSIKSQAYPLARTLYLYSTEKTSDQARQFLNFVRADAGQAAADRAGFVGLGTPSEEEAAEHAAWVKNMLADPKVLPSYKDLIRSADRKDSLSNLHFEKSSSVLGLTNNSLFRLRQIADRLARSGADRGKIILIGFADNRGGWTSNMNLSKRRAETVAAKLREFGFTNLVASGFGEAMPIASNETEAGRALNRRVEIWIDRAK